MILADGPAILWEFKACEHLNADLPGIDELRTSISWMFMTKGDKAASEVERWADEIVDLVNEYGGGNRRIAVDKLDGVGLHALEARQLIYTDGTIRVCEAGMARIYEHPIPGVTERELWAHLHFENARSGGESPISMLTIVTHSLLTALEWRMNGL